MSLILKELINRLRTKVDVYSNCFERQNICRLDKSRLKAYNATRRAGKSDIMAKEALEPCVNEHGVTVLYMGLTLDSVREIIYDVIIREIERCGVAYKGYEREGVIKILETNSKIKLVGIDTSYREMKKVLGTKPRRVLIDESGSMTINMEKLIYQMIGPALIDLQGEIILGGTCEDIPNTFFEKVTTGKEKGWSIHRWTTEENPYMADLFKKEIDTILSNNPLAVNTSWFKTHYLNIWTTDDSKKIYKLSDHNFILSSNFTNPIYTLAVDLGSNDDSAFVVQSYDPKHPYSIVNESYKSPDMDFTDVANKVKWFIQKYPISKLIVDGANKQGVEEMRRRHGLPFNNAEKKDKITFMRILNDDLVQGRVKIIREQNLELVTEIDNLIYNKDKTEEDPRCQNHLCDALLYGHRDLRAYLYEPPKPEENNLNDEFMDKYERQLMGEFNNDDY
jgi:hypothetical protein